MLTFLLFLQTEMKQLVRLHDEQTESLQEKGRQLQMEEMRNRELREKYHGCKQQVSESLSYMANVS